MIDNPNKFLFLHVPRTAGSELTNLYYHKHWKKHITQDRYLKKYTCEYLFKKHRKFSDYVEDYQKDFSDYSIWTITRNTFDLVWSSWFLSKKSYGELSFSEWIEWLHVNKHEQGNRINQSLYVEGVKNLNIISYENLVSDLREKLDLHTIKKFNANKYKSRKSHYSLDYSNDDIEKVKEMYKEDIEKYSFEFHDWR